MINFTTVVEIENAETKDLIAFYNEHNAEKPVKKFADRQTALKRCTALLESLQPKVEDGKEVEAQKDESAPATHEQAEEERKHFWPFGDGKAADSRHGERRNPTIEVPVVVEKAAISEPAAAMLRMIAGSNGHPLDKNGDEATPEETDLWASGTKLLDSAPARSAFKALVIAGLAHNNEREGEKMAVQLTEKGWEAFKSLPEGYGVELKVEKRPLSHASNAAGVAASWADPAVHAARLKRDGVMVTVDGKTTTHKSTRDAFRFYRLMDSKHIRFRGILKAAGTATYEEGKKSYAFAIVGVDANTKFDK
jgi:hypothetical protein